MIVKIPCQTGCPDIEYEVRSTSLKRPRLAVCPHCRAEYKVRLKMAPVVETIEQTKERHKFAPFEGCKRCDHEFTCYGANNDFGRCMPSV